MEQYKQDRENARKKLRNAEHILTVSYPALKEQKMLTSVLENTFYGMLSSVSSILNYERKYKRVPAFTDNFSSKYRVFEQKIQKKYQIPKEFLDLLLELREKVNANKQSPMSFGRKDKYVICSQDYETTELTPEQLNKYVYKAKLFIGRINLLLNKNESRDIRSS